MSTVTLEPTETAANSESKSLKRLRTEMNRVFFDFTDDHVLVYQDPTIGILRSDRLQIAIKLNRKTAALEVQYQAETVESFDVRAGNIAQTCQTAVVAYYRLYQELVRPESIGSESKEEARNELTAQAA
jgi:hypothetical protein